MQKEALEFIKEKTDEMEFPPTRMTQTEGNSTILSWIVPGKYAGMEINQTGIVFAWITFETGTPDMWFVSAAPAKDSCIDFACYYDRIHVGLIKLQDFVE